MRGPLPVALAFLAGLSLPTLIGATRTNPKSAQDVEAIRAATVRHFETFNAGDAAAHVAHHLAPNTSFGPDGGLLDEFASNEGERKSLQAAFDAGLKVDLGVRHLDTRIYGNTAVVTGYVVGTVTPAGGSPQRTLARRTAVLVKQGREWKEVHTHSSPVIGADVP